MDSAQLINRLDKLGIKIRIDTLRSWAKQGLISGYETYYESRPKKQPGRPPKPGSKKAKERAERKKEKKRPGHYSKWPPNIVEEAAAVWAVREEWRKIRGEKGKRLSKDKIDVIKRAASLIDGRPFAVYTLPRITGPLSTQHLDPKDIKMKFVSEDCDGLDLFPGADNTEKVDCLNKLVIIWVAAIEKVRAWKSAGIETQVKSDLGSEWENPLLAEKVDLSQIDPWLVNVPCPWKIDKPACVAFRWSSWGTEFLKLPTALLKSDYDDLVLLENFVDTRQFFKIDVVESAEWAKATRQEIERMMRSSTSPAEQFALSTYREWIMTYFPHKE